MSKDIAEINSDGYDIFLQERLRHDKVDRIEWTVLPPNDLTHFFNYLRNKIELNAILTQ